MLSKATIYAIRVLVYMATQNQRSPYAYMSVQQIAKVLNLPVYFLSKVVKQLARRNIVETSRGIKGGVRFKKKPAEITLYDIIQVFEGDKRFLDCIVGLPACEEFEGCTFHRRYLKIRDQLINLFKKTTVAEIARQLQSQQIKETVS